MFLFFGYHSDAPCCAVGGFGASAEGFDLVRPACARTVDKDLEPGRTERGRGIKGRGRVVKKAVVVLIAGDWRQGQTIGKRAGVLGLCREPPERALRHRPRMREVISRAIDLRRRQARRACPVQPVKMRPGTILWDKRDLDKWIDAMKEGTEMATQDAILAKL